METCLFPGVAELLDQLDVRGLPWGIVTNKPARFTVPLMQELGLSGARGVHHQRRRHNAFQASSRAAACASGAMAIRTRRCIYLGDDIRDVQASLAAGMEPVIARYGYLGSVAPLNPGARDTS